MFLPHPRKPWVRGKQCVIKKGVARENEVIKVID